MIAALLGLLLGLAGAGPTPPCGNGLLDVDETCDDGGTEDADGCSAACLEEEGWECTGEPSDCRGVCGDGLVRDVEECDDGATADGDGCSATCGTEAGFECGVEEPSVCVPGSICGDGHVTGSEDCDDGGTDLEDGCDGTCSQEPKFHCETSGEEPSICAADTDEDDIWDSIDNCPRAANPSQRDADDDGVGDKCQQTEDEGCSAGGGGGGLGLGVGLAFVCLLTLRRRRFVA